jgi:hypothetical protein
MTGGADTGRRNHPKPRRSRGLRRVAAVSGYSDKPARDAGVRYNPDGQPPRLGQFAGDRRLVRPCGGGFLRETAGAAGVLEHPATPDRSMEGTMSEAGEDDSTRAAAVAPPDGGEWFTLWSFAGHLYPRTMRCVNLWKFYWNDPHIGLMTDRVRTSILRDFARRTNDLSVRITELDVQIDNLTFGINDPPDHIEDRSLYFGLVAMRDNLQAKRRAIRSELLGIELPGGAVELAVSERLKYRQILTQRLVYTEGPHRIRKALMSSKWLVTAEREDGTEQEIAPRRLAGLDIDIERNVLTGDGRTWTAVRVTRRTATETTAPRMVLTIEGEATEVSTQEDASPCYNAPKHTSGNEHRVRTAALKRYNEDGWRPTNPEFGAWAKGEAPQISGAAIDRIWRKIGETFPRKPGRRKSLNEQESQ